MSTLGSLHILAPEIPDGLTCWRLQVRVDDGQTPAGGTPTHETLLLSDGELKRIRERAAKRPTAILLPPEPTISAATYETLRVEIGKMRALYDTLTAAHAALQTKLALAEASLAAARANTASVQAELVTARADLDTVHADLAAVRADLAVAKADLDADRDSLRVAMEAADRLQAELTQSEALRAAEATIALPPWADLGRAFKRLFGI